MSQLDKLTSSEKARGTAVKRETRGEEIKRAASDLAGSITERAGPDPTDLTIRGEVTDILRAPLESLGYRLNTKSLSRFGSRTRVTAATRESFELLLVYVDPRLIQPHSAGSPPLDWGILGYMLPKGAHVRIFTGQDAAPYQMLPHKQAWKLQDELLDVEFVAHAHILEVPYQNEADQPGFAALILNLPEKAEGESSDEVRPQSTDGDINEPDLEGGAARDPERQKEMRNLLEKHLKDYAEAGSLGKAPAKALAEFTSQLDLGGFEDEVTEDQLKEIGGAGLIANKLVKWATAKGVIVEGTNASSTVEGVVIAHTIKLSGTPKDDTKFMAYLNDYQLLSSAKLEALTEELG